MDFKYGDAVDNRNDALDTVSLSLLLMVTIRLLRGTRIRITWQSLRIQWRAEMVDGMDREVL